MLGLPAEPGAVGAIMLVLGVVAATALVLLGRRRIAAELGVPLRSIVSLATLATLATTIAAGPFVLWRVVEDIRYTSRLTTQQAEEIGASMNGIDERVFERIRERVPPDATYVIAAGPDVPERARAALPRWAALALLPRVPVEDPRRADWVITWELQPSALGVPVTEKRAIVAPKSEHWYLARVIS